MSRHHRDHSTTPSSEVIWGGETGIEQTEGQIKNSSAHSLWSSASQYKTAFYKIVSVSGENSPISLHSHLQQEGQSRTCCNHDDRKSKLNEKAMSLTPRSITKAFPSHELAMCVKTMSQHHHISKIFIHFVLWTNHTESKTTYLQLQLFTTTKNYKVTQYDHHSSTERNTQLLSNESCISLLLGFSI